MIGRLDDKTQGDLDAPKPVFMLREPKSRSSRSQSTHSSEEAGKHRGSQGVQEGGDAMTKSTEGQPVAVSAKTKRAGESPPGLGSNRRFGQSGC